MDELQLEETQRTNQQAQDLIPYDPNAADRFSEGYTPVGEGRDDTPVEQVDPVRVGEVEATAEINSDLGINNPQDLASGGSDFTLNERVPDQKNINSQVPFNDPSRPQNLNVNNLPDTANIPVSVGNNPQVPDRQVPQEPVIPTPEPPVVPPVNPPYLYY